MSGWVGGGLQRAVTGSMEVGVALAKLFGFYQNLSPDAREYSTLVARAIELGRLVVSSVRL